MSEYYLRVEGVNLNESVYDTNDISTIRGGGFQLLTAVESLAGLDFLEKISTGASKGLFIIRDGHDPQAAVKEVKKKLLDETGAGNLFVVDWLDGAGLSFREIQERLLAANRWSQWRQLTVPWTGEWVGAEKPCSIDGVRGVRQAMDKEPAPTESSFVHLRRTRGRDLRQVIYKEILGSKISEYEYTDDLETHCRLEGHVLDGKMAFVYFDGNKFGKISRRYCRTDDDLKKFDLAVQKNFRHKFLKDLIEAMVRDEHGITAGGAVRLETLMWGGDEFAMVLPAWWGLDAVRSFYELEPRLHDGTPLTHACGLVFCHHKAPILRIRKLASELADHAKAGLGGSPPESHAQGDVFHYLVLESFDTIEGEAGHFIKTYYQPVSPDVLLLKGGALGELMKNINVVKSIFPRGKVYEVIEAVRKGCGYNAVKRIFERGKSECPEPSREELDRAVEDICLGDPRRWFIIADLWDYV